MELPPVSWTGPSCSPLSLSRRLLAGMQIPVGVLAVNACGISLDKLTPTLGSHPWQALSKYRPSQPYFSSSPIPSNSRRISPLLFVPDKTGPEAGAGGVKSAEIVVLVLAPPRLGGACLQILPDPVNVSPTVDSRKKCQLGVASVLLTLFCGNSCVEKSGNFILAAALVVIAK